MNIKQFKVGSLLKRADRDEAALELAKGEIVGIFNRGVCALWFDGGDPNAIKKVATIKGEGRGGKTIALTLSLDDFVPMIDLENVSENIKRFLLSSNLRKKIGSLCFIRAPLKKKYQKMIPSHAKSYEEGVCLLQNWDSHGHIPSEQFIKRVRELGVVHPGVTSMNLTGEKEIVDQQEAEEFCKSNNIPIFLKDPTAHPNHKGSYTIITLGRDGIRLARDGNIPGWIIEQIIDITFIRKGVRKSNYPQIEFPKEAFSHLTSEGKRMVVLGILKGSSY